MDKEKLKQIWKENDVVIVIGGIGLSTVILAGAASAVVATRVIKKNPVRLQFNMTPEFLAGIRGIPNPTMTYAARPQ